MNTSKQCQNENNVCYQCATDYCEVCFFLCECFKFHQNLFRSSKPIEIYFGNVVSFFVASSLLFNTETSHINEIFFFSNK